MKSLASRNRKSKVWINLESDTIQIGILAHLTFQSFVQMVNPRTTYKLTVVYTLIYLPFLAGQLYIMNKGIQKFEDDQK
jgi:hypothetical protein